MSETWLSGLTNTAEERREFEQELAVFKATEVLCRVLEERGLNKADLARLLGTSRANVTALLSGSRNLTIRTLADVATVLGVRIEFQTEALRGGEYIMTPPPVLQRSPLRRPQQPMQQPQFKDAANAASAAAVLSNLAA
jgi:transcriptional regulator with XRE-family HTH domain